MHPLTDQTNGFSGLRALWVEIVYKRCIHFIDTDLFLMGSGASEQAQHSYQMSAVERASETISAEQANE